MSHPAPLGDHPYLHGNYAPVDRESTHEKLEVVGELPRDLAGTFVRNGSNPRFAPKGRYHWFDGDGMLHAVRIEDGRATYRNRWVRGDDFLEEERAGGPLWTGLMEKPDFSHPRGPYKNTANTDVVFHAGKLLALWWMSGDAYQVRLTDLETCGKETFGGTHTDGISAHPKVDPGTGEMRFIRFGMAPPFLHYGVADRTGRVVHYTPIPTPGPRLQHDIAITERFTILMDLPMYNDPEQLRAGKVRVRFFRDQPARFGLVPRLGTAADVKWFEAAPCYVYHAINAWEEGDEVVMVGCRIADPLVGDPANPKSDRVVPEIGLQRLAPVLHRWRFDLKSGRVREEQLDDVLSEFPRMDNRRLGRKSAFSYNPTVAASPTLFFDGVTKYAHEQGTSEHHAYPEGWFGGEVVFAPRAGGTEEDDGYLLTFVANERTFESELHVLDAKRPSAAPLARVRIPQRVPTGYHAWWVSAEEEAGA